MLPRFDFEFVEEPTSYHPGSFDVPFSLQRAFFAHRLLRMHFSQQMSLPDVKYQRVHTSEEDPPASVKGEALTVELSNNPYARRSSLGTVILCAVTAALAVSLTVVSTLYIQDIRHNNPAPLPLLTCGNTIHEARQAGCPFDRLTKAWLPAECSRKYEEEFLEYPASRLNMTDGWKYYEDTPDRAEVTDEDMALYAETRPMGDMSWVSTTRMHLAHCAFVLMRRANADETGVRLDKTSDFASHAKHCLSMLLASAMKAPDIDIVQSEGQVGFGAC
jgi:hypothetical protein